MNARLTTTGLSERRGILAPAVALCLLVVLAAVALILDRLWLQAAQVELRTTAEAAALAAGQELAADDLLRSEADSKQRLDAARAAAAAIAGRNLVAGDAVRLDPYSPDDVRFGRLALQIQTGRTVFLRTDYRPTTVVVTTRRTRERQNPVALFFQELTGQAAGDVAAAAEATIDNRVVGIRPFIGTPAPALPIAILFREEGREDTWDAQILGRRGLDQYAWHEATRRILRQPDGIPEIVLRSMPVRGDARAANIQLVDLGSGLREASLARQITRGLTLGDLADWDGELRVDGKMLPITSSAVILGRPIAALKQMIGQCRMGLLYVNHRPSGTTGLGRLDCVGLMAGRIMSVRMGEARACEIVFQPGVLTTPTALLADDALAAASPEDVRNPYIYKLHLTQ